SSGQLPIDRIEGIAIHLAGRHARLAIIADDEVGICRMIRVVSVRELGKRRVRVLKGGPLGGPAGRLTSDRRGSRSLVGQCPGTGGTDSALLLAFRLGVFLGRGYRIADIGLVALLRLPRHSTRPLLRGLLRGRVFRTVEALLLALAL